ncbi:MAG: hypothetical protein SPI30_07040 [Prevotella sp.]|nr:hypothetical protein [Prevotella sp.]
MKGGTVAAIKNHCIDDLTIVVREDNRLEIVKTVAIEQCIQAAKWHCHTP